MKLFVRSALIVLTISFVLSPISSGAEVSGPVTAGSNGGPFSAPAFDIVPYGYVVEEFYIEGDAYAYKFKESSEQTKDGRWATERRKDTQPFKSRILVVRPGNAKDFNGTVIVHWQNVTAGFELGSVSEGEYMRGYAWVGVSAQKIGIDGVPGPERVAGLKHWDDERYGSLVHPGDAYSYDIFTQAGHAVAPDRSKSGIDPMGGLPVKRLVAAGASQSAGRLRTYIDGVHPIEKVFDGFIPYIDFGTTIPFDRDFGVRTQGRNSTQIRDDISAKVLVVNSETETQAYSVARQPDSSTFRFWEVAGTSHVSVQRGSSNPGMENPNWHSFQPVYAASLRHMHHWLKDGTEPPKMQLIEMEGEGSMVIVRDENGNAKGGIRLPEFAVPTATHTGTGKRVAGGNRFAFLYGNAEDFSAEKLTKLYPTQDKFLAAYEKALATSVKEGMVLAEDASILSDAARSWSNKLD
jgi:hypothetical protein